MDGWAIAIDTGEAPMQLLSLLSISDPQGSGSSHLFLSDTHTNTRTHMLSIQQAVAIYSYRFFQKFEFSESNPIYGPRDRNNGLAGSAEAAEEREQGGRESFYLSLIHI